jgi:tetratricopeptide (TPR) repeat protein
VGVDYFIEAAVVRSCIDFFSQSDGNLLMLRFVLCCVVAVSCFSGSAGPCTASDESGTNTAAGWIGNSFMPREGIKYRMGERELSQPLPLPLDVFAEDGDWLFVSGGKVRKADVVSTKKAAAYYEELLKKNPRNSWALCQRGILVGIDGELDQALKDFDAAIECDAKNAEAFVMRGILHATNEEFDRAIKEFDQAIQIRPDYADAYHQRGFYYFENFDDNDKAIADFNAAIKACPEFSEAYAGRGLVYQYLQRPKDAVADYDKAISLDPYAVDSLSNRALIRAAGDDETLRDGKLAIADATKACELTKYEDVETLTILAAAYAEAGRFDEAVETQMKAVLQSSGNSKIELLRKVGLYQQKKPYRYAEELQELLDSKDEE